MTVNTEPGRGQKLEEEKAGARVWSPEPWPGTFWAEGVKQTPRLVGVGKTEGQAPLCSGAIVCNLTRAERTVTV